jgi:hypothetical protein
MLGRGRARRGEACGEGGQQHMRELPLAEDVTRTMARSVSAMMRGRAKPQRELKVTYVIIMIPLI